MADQLVLNVSCPLSLNVVFFFLLALCVIIITAGVPVSQCTTTQLLVRWFNFIKAPA